MDRVESSLLQELQLFKHEYDRGGCCLPVCRQLANAHILHCVYITMQFTQNAHVRIEPGERMIRGNYFELTIV